MTLEVNFNSIVDVIGEEEWKKKIKDKLADGGLLLDVKWLL